MVWRIKLVLVGLAILACAYAGTIAYDIFFGGPPLSLRDGGGWTIVDLQIRGTRHSSPDRVRIVEVDTEKVVWEIVPAGLSMKIGSFRLVPGSNPVEVGLDDPVGVVEPRGSDTFDLLTGRDYLLSVWGPNEFGYRRKSTVRFSL